MPGAELRFGEFIGRRVRSAETDNFSFVEIADDRHGEIPVHTHEDAHFVFIERGLYLTSANGAQGQCTAGAILFNPSGTTHRDRFATLGGRFLTLSLRGGRLRELMSRVALPQRATLTTSLCAHSSAYRVRYELATPDAYSPIVLEGLALELIGACLRVDRRRRAAPAWLRRAKEMLEESEVERVHIADVAREVGVHPFHLARTFKRFHGVTPGEFARECRLRRATELLADARLSIAEIAIRCGYADQSQFTRAFRARMGVPPGAYRSR